ncbi:heat-shock protein [Photobacterium swingsii]|uniref:Heat shock protein C n=2 Tax=Vibrio TaxID=662 RepID=A0A0H3ZQD9_9VIBR|nr:Heat shock protein C [Vibrio tasmaniensis]AKN40843.1 hypothetical protein [Vibrio sp. 1F_189]
MTVKRLFNLPDREVQQWSVFGKDDISYDFGHLDAQKVTFQHPERNERYILYFTFSHHCFTRGIKDHDAPTEADIYPYPVDRRIFDERRYALSLHLPQIIETLPEQFCYHGGHSRYCSCTIREADGTEVSYQVVYRVWRKSGKMRFHVESAYPLDEPLGRVKKVNFWVICHNLLLGKPMPRPAAQ